MTAKYDRIGVNYADLRRPDPRIACVIDEALGSARSVVNIGAGTGSYEPAGRSVTAVEPSAEMIRKRPTRAATAVQFRTSIRCAAACNPERSETLTTPLPTEPVRRSDNSVLCTYYIPVMLKQ